MYNPDQDLPDCMMPDGGEACGSYARLYAAFKEQALKLNNAERGWAAASQSVLALESRLEASEKALAMLKEAVFDPMRGDTCPGCS